MSDAEAAVGDFLDFKTEATAAYTRFTTGDMIQLMIAHRLKDIAYYLAEISNDLRLMRERT